MFARYLTPSPAHRRLGLVCLGVGSARGRRHPPERRVPDCYGLTLVIQGAGWLEWGERTRRLPVRAAAAFVSFPGVPLVCQADPGGWSERWVLFDGPAAVAHEALGGLDRDNPVVGLGPGAQGLQQTFDRLNQAVETGSEHRDVVASALVHQLLAQLLVSRVETGLSRVVRYFEEHAVEPLTVGEHARRLGLDEVVLREEVRRATGAMPKEYILRTRLSRAKGLLLSTDRSVREVSRAVGYDDPAYFTRLFARRVGLPPTEFRRAAREDRG